MARTHLRNQHGGSPAQGPPPDLANPTAPAAADNDFPDAPDDAPSGDQDKPDLDAFAARMGTDTLAGTSDTAETATAAAPSDTSDTSETAMAAAPSTSATSSPSTTTCPPRSSARETPPTAASESATTTMKRTASKAASSVAAALANVSSRLGELADKGRDAVVSDDGDGPDLAALRNRVDSIRTVMVTTIDERGTLSSRPLTTQRVTDDGDVLFVVDRDADWVGVSGEAANVAFVDDGSTWVSVAGRGGVVDDAALLHELWNPMLDAFFPDGEPEPGATSGAVVYEVAADCWEYWTAPNKLTQVIEIVSAKFGDGTPDLGDSGTIET